MPTLSDVETLLGNAELGKLLGVSRQRVSQLVTRDDFPAPRAVLIMGSIWALDDVIQGQRHAADVIGDINRRFDEAG